MKTALRFTAIVLVILLLSAILAPILYRFLPFKFERIFNRLVMIFTLVAVAAFVRSRRDIGSILKSYGIVWEKNQSPRYLAVAFLTGVITLIFLTAFKVVIGDAAWNPAPLGVAGWTVQILRFIVTGFLIGFIEEFFFRGFIYSAFTKGFRWNVAASVALTSLFYSLVHFVSHKKPFIGPEPTFVDSLRLVVAPLMSLANWHEFWPAAVGLFLFGLVLNDLVIRTGSLYPSIGLHAGCVFYLKIDGLFVDFLDKAPLFFTTKQLYDGAVGWVFLLAMGGVLRFFLKHNLVQKGEEG